MRSRVTVKVADPSVSETVSLLTKEIIGSSSSVITKSAVAESPVMVALVALSMVKVAVSANSSVVSSNIGT